MITILIGRTLDGAALAVGLAKSPATTVINTATATPMVLRMIRQSPPDDPALQFEALEANMCRDALLWKSKASQPAFEGS